IQRVERDRLLDLCAGFASTLHQVQVLRVERPRLCKAGVEVERSPEVSFGGGPVPLTPRGIPCPLEMNLRKRLIQIESFLKRRFLRRAGHVSRRGSDLLPCSPH